MEMFADWNQKAKPQQLPLFLLDVSESTDRTKINTTNNAIRKFVNTDALISQIESHYLDNISHYYPVIVFVSDGKTKYDYKSDLTQLNQYRLFTCATKIALAIGDDADKDILAEFTGNTEMVIPIHSLEEMHKVELILSFYAATVIYKYHLPLMLAAIFNLKETAELLINNGANVNAKTTIYNYNGSITNQTALMIAAEHNSKETAALLIKHGADINAQNSGSRGGQTALMIAAEHNAIETAKLLVKHQANINAKTKWRNYSGCTALVFAAWYEAKEIVELLIEHGADVNATRNDGQTAVMFAKSKNNKEIVQLLIEYGADAN